MNETFRCVWHNKYFPDEDEIRPIGEKRSNSVNNSGSVSRFNFCKRCHNKRSKIAYIDDVNNDPVGRAEKGMIGRAKYSARKYSLPFNLDVYRNEFTRLVRNTAYCQICGGQFSENYCTGKTNNEPHNRSIDKIVPDLGYTIGNIQIVHYRCNIMKQNCTQEELVEWCKAVIAFSEKN